ncbi:GNAT family N-acetyltransferase [Sphaerimonospora cavernae]|uniref:GNAT family N-acetyltransferase n=1 Tax=Sphaerimonospora cavernae TaxID=1740611 RepID=A0ABV6U1D3_9ACTN
MPLDRATPAQAEAPIHLTLAMPHDTALIEAAIQLGNRARATLGHMPFAGYHQAASKGTLLLACLGEEVVGYALYDLARRRVRLNHLCVHPQLRKRGIARMLVEWISERHADHLGISARCRHDYRLGEMWIKLGFTQVSERPGRSHEGHILVNWWRDHHHPNLFTRDAETVLVRAAIDINVLRDFVETSRADRTESLALVANHVVDRLELVRTAALDQEIDNMEGKLRGECTRQAQPFTSVRTNGKRVREVARYLVAEAQQKHSTYPTTDQDQLDLKHVAEAIAADLNVLVTRDADLARILGPAAEKLGLRVLRPVDVLLHLDELVRAHAYRPAALLDTSFAERLVGSGQEEDLAPLANKTEGERPRDFLKMSRDLAVAGQDRIGIYGPTGNLVATFATVHSNGVLRVPVLRVVNDPLADTLAHQLLFRLRQQARFVGAAIVRITDPYLQPHTRLAAVNDGFRNVDADLYAYALDVCGPAPDVEHRAVLAARRAGLPEPASLRSSMPAVAAAELERIWWPTKITDSELPTYLIPIKQVFSIDLLGVPTSLLPRNDALGLNREHVYYRSPRGPQIEAPARLLWYMSQGGGSSPYPAAVIACSQLDSVVSGTPDELHTRFRHLGVWDKKTIERAAHDGRAQALRFTNTEIFPHRVSRDHLRQLADLHGVRAIPPRGPLLIPAELFAAVYKEGRAQ